MAYYPTGNSAGTAVIIGGSGGAPLQPYTNPSNLALFSTTFQDPVSGDPPTTLAAAGNASQTGAAVADRRDEVAVGGGQPVLYEIVRSSRKPNMAGCIARELAQWSVNCGRTGSRPGKPMAR